MEDLTTLFILHVEALRDANPEKVDSTTLVVNAQPTIRLSDLDDLNTAYYVALNA